MRGNTCWPYMVWKHLEIPCPPWAPSHPSAWGGWGEHEKIMMRWMEMQVMEPIVLKPFLLLRFANFATVFERNDDFWLTNGHFMMNI